jgi:Icc-related predicted phosphoesterase
MLTIIDPVSRPFVRSLQPPAGLKQFDVLCKVPGGILMRIIVFGDVHMDLGNFSRIPAVEVADSVIITGDITNYGSRQAAREIIAAVRKVNDHIVALAGNLDNKDVADYLEEEGISLHGRGQRFGRIGIFGVGGSNPTPFNTPIEYSEEELQSFLAQGYEQVKTAPHHILVSHAPPLKTKTDRISSGVHVGSTAVRAFIEEYQPAFCLCGHIHESRAQDRIGNTQIINPGMIKDGGWIEITADSDAVNASLHIL